MVGSTHLPQAAGRLWAPSVQSSNCLCVCCIRLWQRSYISAGSHGVEQITQRQTEQPLVHNGFLSQLTAFACNLYEHWVYQLCVISIRQPTAVPLLCSQRGKGWYVSSEPPPWTCQIKLHGQRPHWCEGREKEDCCLSTETYCSKRMLVAWTEPREQLQKYFRGGHMKWEEERRSYKTCVSYGWVPVQHPSAFGTAGKRGEHLAELKGNLHLEMTAD